MMKAPRNTATPGAEAMASRRASARPPWPRPIPRHGFPILFPLAILLLFASPVLAGPRDTQWKAVQDAVNRGLPKTAITNLEPTIQAALKDKAYAEAVKAIGKKIVLEGNIQGNKPEEKIVRLEADTICVHGDTPNSVVLARQVRAALEAAGVVVRAFS